jgi:hypothetical protein
MELKLALLFLLMVVQYSKATHKQINIVSSTTEIEYVASSIVTHTRDYFSMVICY